MLWVLVVHVPLAFSGRGGEEWGMGGVHAATGSENWEGTESNIPL